MTHSPDHHIEHSEHAAHAAHDPFDRRVTMTIAIVAAVLAFVTMLSHRAHNGTLILQAEANRLQTEAARLETLANVYHTQASDQWAFYQAKNIRNHEFQSFLKIMAVMARSPGSEDDAKKTTAYWSSQVAKYEKELPEMMAKAKQLEKSAEENHTRSSELLTQAGARVADSHEVHDKGDRYDLAELGVEFGLVLCSIAVLTKRRGFWYTGMISSGVGAALALSAFFGLFLGHGHH